MSTKGKLPVLIAVAVGLSALAAVQRPTLSPATAVAVATWDQASPCGDSLSGIWMAEFSHEWACSEGVTTRGDLRILMTLVEAPDGDVEGRLIYTQDNRGYLPDGRRCESCDERWVFHEGIEGRRDGDALRLDGVGWEMASGPRQGGYNLDHYEGLRDGADVMVLRNDDGGWDVGNERRFSRITCLP